MAEIPVQIVVNSRAGEIISGLTTTLSAAKLETQKEEINLSEERKELNTPPSSLINSLKQAFSKEQGIQLASPNFSSTKIGPFAENKITSPNIELKEFEFSSKPASLTEISPKESRPLHLPQFNTGRVSNIILQEIRREQQEKISLKNQDYKATEIELPEISIPESKAITFESPSLYSRDIQLKDISPLQSSEINLEEPTFQPKKIDSFSRINFESKAISLAPVTLPPSKNIGLPQLNLNQPLSLEMKDVKIDGIDISLPEATFNSSKVILSDVPNVNVRDIELQAQEFTPAKAELQKHEAFDRIPMELSALPDFSRQTLSLSEISIPKTSIDIKNEPNFDIIDIPEMKSIQMPESNIEINNNQFIATPVTSELGLPFLEGREIDLSELSFTPSSAELTKQTLKEATEIYLSESKTFPTQEIFLPALNEFERRDIELQNISFNKSVTELRPVNFQPIESLQLTESKPWKSTFRKGTELPLSYNIGEVG